MRISSTLLCLASSSTNPRFISLSKNCLLVPKNASASSSVKSGHFVKPLRHVTLKHSAGAFSSPIVQSRGYASKPAGISKQENRSAPKPQRGSSKSKKAKKSRPEKPEPLHQFTEIPQPIPQDPLEPPEIVRGWPTPVISQHELDKFLRPLYQRGWSLEYRRRKHENSPERYHFASLQLYLENLSWDGFFSLAEFIGDLEKVEKVRFDSAKSTDVLVDFVLQHNVEWKYKDKAGLDFKSLYNLGLPLPSPVVLLLRTHTAILLRNRGANDIIEDSLADKNIEGVTLRDIRFAILVDAFIRHHNADKPQDSAIAIRMSIAGLENASRHLRLDGLLTGAPREFEKTVWRKRKRGPKGLAVADFYLGNDWSVVLDAKADKERSSS